MTDTAFLGVFFHKRNWTKVLYQLSQPGGCKSRGDATESRLLAISRARMYFARLTIAIAEIIATTRSLQRMRFFLMKTKFYYLIYNSWHSSVYGIYQLVLLGIQSLDSVSFLPGWEEALWKLSSFYVSKQKPKKFRCCKKKCHRTNKTQAALFFDAAYLKKLLQSFAFLHFIDKESEMTLVSSTT